MRGVAEGRIVVGERVIVGTVVTKSHLAYARALAWSLAETQSDSKLYCLLADRIDDYFDPRTEPFEVITIEALDRPELLHKLCFYYTRFELCNALRGELHHYLWKQHEIERWLYLDADIMVVGDLRPVLARLDDAQILLNPHRCLPYEPGRIEPYETTLLRVGVFNSGFLGLRRGAAAAEFLHWYRSRLQRYCFHDLVRFQNRRRRRRSLARGLFVDQLWLNLVPAYFEKVDLLCDPGANLAHWNLDCRRLVQTEDGRFTVDAQALRFVHFSGWDINEPYKVSAHSKLYVDWVNPAWCALAAKYRDYLVKARLAETATWPYAFSHFNSGGAVTPDMRRAYWEQLVQGRWNDIDPFDEPQLFESTVTRLWRGIKCLGRHGRLRSVHGAAPRRVAAGHPSPPSLPTCCCEPSNKRRFAK